MFSIRSSYQLFIIRIVHPTVKMNQNNKFVHAIGVKLNATRNLSRNIKKFEEKNDADSTNPQITFFFITNNICVFAPMID